LRRHSSGYAPVGWFRWFGSRQAGRARRRLMFARNELKQRVAARASATYSSRWSQKFGRPCRPLYSLISPSKLQMLNPNHNASCAPRTRSHRPDPSRRAAAHRRRRTTISQRGSQGGRGTPGQRRALLKELVVEVRVESRDSIIPTFRLPATRFALRKAWWAALDSNRLPPRYV